MVWLVTVAAQLVVHRRQVEIEFADVFGLNSPLSSITT